MAAVTSREGAMADPGAGKIRGKKRKLFYKEAAKVAQRLSAVGADEWVDALHKYASVEELHLQIFPKRDALHKKIISQSASQLGSFLKDLVKKYLELYKREWGASAALVFSFIGYVGRTLNGDTKLSELWLSIIDGEDKETARHIGNMYGLALMNQVDECIEKLKQAGITENKAFCQSAEPDDYTSVSLTPKAVRVLTSRRRMRKGSELNPPQSTGHEYNVIFTSKSLTDTPTQTSEEHLKTKLLGTSILRHHPLTKCKKGPATDSIVLPPHSIPSVLGTSESLVPVSDSVNCSSSAIGPLPVESPYTSSSSCIPKASLADETSKKTSPGQKTQPVSSGRAKVARLPDSPVRFSKPQRTSSRHKTLSLTANSTRSGRILKKKVRLDL